MNQRIVLLSGAVSSGKTTLADSLCERFGMIALKTGDSLRGTLKDGERANRRLLQTRGDALDRKTNGRWVADALSRRTAEIAQGASVIVDSVRIASQIDAIRAAYGSRVVHIHLTASQRELASRYNKHRGKRARELASYAAVRENATERAVDGLAQIADIVVDTQQSTVADVVVRAASHLGLYPKSGRLVDVVIGGQYGSEGKGNIASYLSRDYDLLVRVGGPNAGHTVSLESGSFVHHQLPSGTLTSNAQLLIGPGAVLDVSKLMNEISECRVDAQRLRIDPNAMTISAKDIRAERRLVATIGSTGQGVGAATAARVMGRSNSSTRLARDIGDLKPFLQPVGGILDDAFAEGKRVLLEGTQGTGLSLYHGEYPFVTSRDTTVSGCLAEAGISPSRVRKIVMVCRTYPIRVQSPEGSTSGSMSQELTLRDIATRSRLPLRQLESTETTSTTGRKRRIAEFDWALLRKATSLNGPTDIALTFADYLDADNQAARRFEQLTSETIRFIEEVERVAGAEVSLVSTRFHPRGIIDRRKW